MFNDVVELMNKVLHQIQERKIQQNPETITDVYIQLTKLHVAMSLIAVHLARDSNKYYLNFLDIEAKDKWIVVLNEKVQTYENIKYGLSCDISKLRLNENSEVLPILNTDTVTKIIMDYDAKEDIQNMITIIVKFEYLLQERFGLCNLLASNSRVSKVKLLWDC